ncbi:MAG: 2-phosphosulfolactate phosphatase [Bacteroidota bacterium]|nr:2-phosphosulfolactate phosphatase [Bacteroidota bacterium]MDP4205689.1 2-phosphosulfolactate phosphatase [Bacteroidota bacterium]
MEINILQLVEGAKNAKGLTVVIDVFRAFSMACYLFDRGAEAIIPVSSIEQAFELKANNPEYLLIGERNERIVPGFDFGNSPTHILNKNFTGKTIIHTTSAGTQGIVLADHADEIITGSFVNASAIIEYIRRQNPETVSLVCMGYSTKYPADEDTTLAEYVKNGLEGKPNDFGEMIERIRRGTGARLLDPHNYEWSPSSDFVLCLSLNRFNYILKVEKKDGLNILRKIDL